MKTKNLQKNNSVKNFTMNVNSNRDFIKLSPTSLRRLSGGYNYFPNGPTHKPKD